MKRGVGSVVGHPAFAGDIFPAAGGGVATAQTAKDEGHQDEEKTNF
jgi:hypothetical protein